jgi:prophage maintenance system killer protein
MIEVYRDVGLYFKPVTAENILEINADFCIEDGFGPNSNALGQIESKLYAAYYYFLSKIHEKNHINDLEVQDLIPEIAGIIAYYIASTQMFPTANKRTAAVAAELFLYENDFNLKYKTIAENGSNELADLIIGIGCNDLDKNKAIEWFKARSVKRKLLIANEKIGHILLEANHEQ